MSTAASDHVGTAREIDVLRRQARMTEYCVRLNTDGVSHEESLMQPPAGNCMNWLLGHLLVMHEHTLGVLGQPTVMEAGALRRYDRGAPPMLNASEAVHFSELLTAWRESCRRIETGMAALSTDRLDQPAPFSPSGDPEETVRTLLTTLAFHQAYHAGQTGVLRRIVGKEGAVR